MTRKTIKMDLVDFEGTRTLAELERFDDHFEIHVREKVPAPEWYRMAAVKEFWHALSDTDEDLSVDGVKTIRETVTSRGKINWDTLSPQARSEKLAETFAAELLYPFEYRATDLERVAQGVSIGDIAKERGVPVSIVETSLEKENYDWCKQWWDHLDGDAQYPALAPLAGEVT